MNATASSTWKRNCKSGPARWPRCLAQMPFITTPLSLPCTMETFDGLAQPPPAQPGPAEPAPAEPGPRFQEPVQPAQPAPAPIGPGPAIKDERRQDQALAGPIKPGPEPPGPGESRRGSGQRRGRPGRPRRPESTPVCAGPAKPDRENRSGYASLLSPTGLGRKGPEDTFFIAPLAGTGAITPPEHLTRLG